MSRKQRWVLALAAMTAVGAEAIAAMELSRNGWEWSYVAYDGVVAIAASLVSVLVWAQRPRGAVGPVLYFYTLVFILMAFRSEPNTAVISGLWLAISLLPAMFVHIVLAFPTGRLETAGARRFVMLVYAHSTGFALATLATGPAGELFGGCGDQVCPPRPPLWQGHTDWFERLTSWRDGTQVALIVGFAVLVVLRVWRATARRRRQLTPIALAAGAVTAVFAMYGAEDSPGWFGDVLQHGAHLGLTVAFLGGYWSRSLERAGVADLLARLAAAPPNEVEGLLARLLRDPELRLHPLGDPALAGLPTHSRVLSEVVGQRGPLAVLSHENTVLDDERLLSAVLSASGLALENAALRDDLVQQLNEVRSSRQRIVEASDRTRRNLERDLHDGAQQRLLSAGMALQLAVNELPAAVGSAQGLLDEAADEIRLAIVEMRELTRGVHPAVLSERGLVPALASLAERSSVPVAISGHLETSVPEAVQVAAYYLVSEALQNVTKHANATAVTITLLHSPNSLTVRISDDGDGDAHPTEGHGLQGLNDRVEALGGTLRIRSPRHGGTELEANLPCG